MKVELLPGAYEPTRAHEKDAGLDMYAMHGGCVKAGQTATFHTGVKVELPEGTVGLLLPKSGLMVKHDILTFGVIDEGYEGEIKVHMFNFGQQDYTVHAGDKISQMIITFVCKPDIEYVLRIVRKSDRGEDGFGSTGR